MRQVKMLGWMFLEGWAGMACVATTPLVAVGLFGPPLYFDEWCRYFRRRAEGM